MYTQLNNAFTDRIAVTEVTRLHLAQANTNPSLCYFIAQAVKPFCERFAAIMALITKQLYHRDTVAYKSQMWQVRLRFQEFPHPSICSTCRIWRG